MKAENNYEGIQLEHKERMEEASKILSFVQLAVTNAPIALEGAAQDGLALVLDDVQQRLGR